ncbi:MAG TPA: SRPBCC family protein, partial [Flavobacteriales bacterium]|nr:SRPBCC family protein [Flavobacteriales bacterium]
RTAMSNKVTVVAKGDREVVISRAFSAPRPLVFDAMSKPEMMKQWFHGPPGWTLVVCEIDLRVDGRYRWVWRNDAGHDMGMGGVYKEVQRPERIVSTEKFDQSWYPGEAVGTLVLTEQGKQTLMTLTVRYESQVARDGVLASPMQTGLDAGYSRLDEFLARQ